MFVFPMNIAIVIATVTVCVLDPLKDLIESREIRLILSLILVGCSIIANIDDIITRAESPAQSFSSNWVGSFGGASKSGSTVEKDVRITFESIEDNGALAGTCTICPDAADSAEASGSYALKGIIDWETNKIRLYGTSWIDRGGLAFMRNFEGTYSPENGTIVGTCETTSGSRGSLWSMTAA